MKDTRTCPHCGRASGWLERHVTACERDRASAARAAAHADEAHEWRNGVTDLDVARLLLALERGTIIHPTHALTRWATVGTSPLANPKRPLNATVNEAIRVGLCRVTTQPRQKRPGVVLTRLEAAPVHARSPRRPLMPACAVFEFPEPGRFWRLLDDLSLVDCQACIDRINR